MKPVDRADLDGILDRKSILLLNQTYLATSYVEFLVTQNSSNVASKKGTCLPLEMWFEILKFARDASVPPRSDAESVVVSLSPYNSQLGSLFHDVTVPDIIAWLPDEDWCGVCQGGIFIETEGSPGTEITAKFVGAQTWAWGDAFCPLCIGIDDCERCMVHTEYLENFGGDEEGSEDEEVSREKEEHKAWMQSRRKELGY
ncbi:hypothetical protein CMUS01_01535 [Colletotrichum musicola]|uniref:Uncharacterized protein n=1 Tax=Colletotrichum musicola TaxID=2175873 RepID=A0A8H6NWV9_9PEZI|nr:hypothetical protein CMUS01_01535 [Colletotrichum musicola]